MFTTSQVTLKKQSKNLIIEFIDIIDIIDFIVVHLEGWMVAQAITPRSFRQKPSEHRTGICMYG